MIKAYEAYKTSVNPEKKPRTGSGVTQIQGALNTATAAGKKIEALDPRTLCEEEKEEALATALNALKGIIEIALTAITETGTEETPEENVSEGDTPQDETSGDASSETTPPPTKKPRNLA